jgi:hypothetical protein
MAGYNLSSRKKSPESQEIPETMVKLNLRVGQSLRDLLVAEASNKGLTLNELIAQLAAQHIGRPELGKIPRKPLGRKPKQTAEITGAPCE